MPTMSQEVLMTASQRYGTVDYSRFQAIRGQYYSWVTYPRAGASTISFFGNTVGQSGITLADTNMPKAGSFGQVYFQLKTISLAVKIWNDDLDGFTLANQALGTLDKFATASDFLAGFVQAGVLTFNVGARPFLVQPKPFLYLPTPGTDPDHFNGGGSQIGAVPTLTNPAVVGLPRVTQTLERENVFRFDPNLLIEPEQQFDVTLAYPQAAIPVIATSIVDQAGPGGVPAGTNTNPFKVGVIFDGVVLRPLQ